MLLDVLPTAPEAAFNPGVRPLRAAVVTVRPARVADMLQVEPLINGFAKQELMLPKSIEKLSRNFREFVVAEHDGRIVGCGGLRLYTHELGEIVALGVSAESHGRGVGRLIVETLLAQAKVLGLKQVIALTLQPGFFAKLGFRQVDVADYPHKVMADCSRCARRATCNEIGFAYDLGV